MSRAAALKQVRFEFDGLDSMGRVKRSELVSVDEIVNRKQRFRDATLKGRAAREAYPWLFYDVCECGSPKDKRSSTCKPCRAKRNQKAKEEKLLSITPEETEERRLLANQRNRDLYAKKREAKRARAKKTYARNREARLAAARNRVLERKYGINEFTHAAIKLIQNDACGICMKPFNGDRYMMHTDHDHITGKVRGILCISCNHAIGVLGDNAEGLRAALRYIEEAPGLFQRLESWAVGQ